MNMFIYGSSAQRKSLATRNRILEAALQLFVAQGYEQTTIREIATQANVSLGLTYRYFSSKEALVLALYADLASQFEAAMQHLPAGSLADRFHAAMSAKLSLLEPYRDALGSLFRTQIDPHSRVAVMSGDAGEVRRRVQSVFAQVVRDSTDVPERMKPALDAPLYAAHLGLLLFWQYDQSPDQVKTRDFLELARDSLKILAPFLGVPAAAQGLARFAGILSGISAGEPVSSDP